MITLGGRRQQREGRSTAPGRACRRRTVPSGRGSGLLQWGFPLPAAGADRRGDRGAAMIAALLVVVMVSMLGTVALAEDLNGSHQSASTAKQLEVATAARSGVDVAAASVEAQLSANAGSLSCPVDGSINAGGTGEAVNGASVESYSLQYAVFSSGTAPTSAQVADMAGGSEPGELSCAVQPTIQTSTQLSAEPATWYLALAAQGASSSTAYQWAGPSSVVVLEVVQGVVTGALTANFPYTMEGWNGIQNGGDMTLDGSAYASTLTCSNGTYNGNVFAGTPASPVTNWSSNGCAIDGNVFVDGTMTLAQLQGSSHGSCSGAGSIFVTGDITITNAGATICGDVVSNGTVTIQGGTIWGSVFAAQGVDMTGWGTVKGSIYSGGPVDISAGTVASGGGFCSNGSCTPAVFADGPVSVSAGSVKGNVVANGDLTVTNWPTISGSAWVASGGTISVRGSNCANGASGGSSAPSTCYTSFTAGGGAPGYAAGYLAGPSASAPFFGTPECPGSTSSQYLTDAPSSPLPYNACAEVSTSPVTYGVKLPQQQLIATFPPLMFNQQAWENSSFEPSGGGASGITWDLGYDNCTASGTDSVYVALKAMSSATKPTVITTTCAIDWGNTSLSGSSPLTLNQNLAVFSGDPSGSGTSGGFTFENDGSPGTVVGNGHALYLIVPWDGSSLPANTLCPSSLSGVPGNGDVYIANSIGGSSGSAVDAFVYTPDNVLATASPKVQDGKVYAGGVIAPAGECTGGGGSALDPVVEPATALFPYGVVSTGGGGANWAASVTTIQ